MTLTQVELLERLTRIMNKKKLKGEKKTIPLDWEYPPSDVARPDLDLDVALQVDTQAVKQETYRRIEHAEVNGFVFNGTDIECASTIGKDVSDYINIWPKNQETGPYRIRADELVKLLRKHKYKAKRKHGFVRLEVL